MRQDMARRRLTFYLVVVAGLQICACCAVFAADLPLIKPGCSLNHIEPGCPWPRTQLHYNVTGSAYKTHRQIDTANAGELEMAVRRNAANANNK